MRPDHALNPLAEINALMAEVEGYRDTAQHLAKAVTALEDENAELRAALAEVMRVIGRHGNRGPRILPSDVWQRARAALDEFEGQP